MAYYKKLKLEFPNTGLARRQQKTWGFKRIPLYMSQIKFTARDIPSRNNRRDIQTIELTFDSEGDYLMYCLYDLKFF